MAPPITYKEVTGTYLSPSGAAIAGTIRFIPSTTVYDLADNVVVPPVPISVTLDGSGEFALDLCCTDAADTNPTGWVWQISEQFAGGREFEFELPSSSPASVSLSQLTPATTVALSYSYATTGELQGLEARMNSLESTALITTAAVVIHPFLVMGA